AGVPSGTSTVRDGGFFRALILVVVGEGPGVGGGAGLGSAVHRTLTDEASLREAKKFQNVRAGGTLLDKVHRIQEAGLEVWSGMIIGFDSDDVGIFDRQVEFIQRARIPFAV